VLQYLENKKDELAVLKEEVDEKRAELNQTRAAEIEMKNKLEEHQKALYENQKRSRHWEEQLGKLRLQSIKELSGEEDEDGHTSLPLFTEDEMADMDKHALKSNIAALEEKVKDVNVDLAVLTEYRRRVEEHTARNNDLQSAVSDRDAIKARLDDLRKRRLEEFMEGFNTISLRLKEMYQMITMGGNAELELVDSLDPFSEGILFSVMPPKKSWKNISNLSGGEKTLSSLALVFALHHYKPTPLYVMDEIDAALDFRNVSIVASYIKERTKNAQFIVISLRNNMFELAARLVGVYKVNHMVRISLPLLFVVVGTDWSCRLRA
jgi:structural maintenance of chromosome 4